MLKRPLHKDYVHQGSRFVLDEGLGCVSGVEMSILLLLTYEPWIILPPIISILFYYRGRLIIAFVFPADVRTL